MMRRFPLGCTVPMPLLIATFVDPVTFHRRIADWPRSMVDGSTENSAMTGFPGVAGPLLLPFEAAGAGGGGGGIGVFLPQPDAKSTMLSAIVRAALCMRRNGNE